VTSRQQRRSLEEAIVDAVREPLIMLGDALRVVAASRSFYRAFVTTPPETEGRPLYELGNDQWDIPALRELLTAVIPQHATIEDFEVEHDFRPSAGEPASHRYGSRNPVRFESPAGASKAASSKFPIIKV
jgi:PAS domain-containing protein